MSRFNDEERNLLLQGISDEEESDSPEVQWETVRLMQRYCQDVGVRHGSSLRDENEGLRRAFKMLEENHLQLQKKMEETKPDILIFRFTPTTFDHDTGICAIAKKADGLSISRRLRGARRVARHSNIF